jgi:N-acylglucosamine 2-epimerase (GlcNAc 2-epimerase).
MEIALRVIDYGWDKEYGGIFYFMDRKGYPTQELEWDQKLWWVTWKAPSA